MWRWLMPQELPKKVACSLLKESGEASLQELVQAAEDQWQSFGVRIALP